MSVGVLTEFGFLYEGSDFEAWKTCMRVTLRARNGLEPADLPPTHPQMDNEQLMALMESDDKIQEAMRDAALHCNQLEVSRLKGHITKLKDHAAKLEARLDAFTQAAVFDPLKRVACVMEEARIPLRNPPRPKMSTFVAAKVPKEKVVNEASDIQYMCRWISRLLLPRIPDTAKGDIASFFKSLSALVKPFPFLRLTPEIRQRIYVLAIDNGLTIDEDEPNLSICSVNRATRKEVRPIFYQQATFAHPGLYHIYERKRDWSPKGVLKAISNWSRLDVRDCMKYLRAFRIRTCVGKLDGWGVFATVTFRFSPETGLSSDVSLEDGTLCTKSIAALDKHVAFVQGRRKAMKLQGESVVMAVLNFPDLWEPGVLRLSGDCNCQTVEGGSMALAHHVSTRC
ncbi:hypothetical protein CB0940_03920 [Cercospora beticola]|uniref:Uncharacterized protein n=1 Tax=Cercospora beticola TaxID=122368 RepID=A0A2G5HLQ1_CERBT|nr:hypothetical protein CB0940_03920 [Cercospora beticola]PIA93445.1 hypothetical protein CB0940_03920 [Cercospora beticola]WPB01122.1 hypothetical protein RHO25_005743 [Cercospora beticola]CAK1364131.1 unnamed protein product [Cercospora beticola]